MGELRRFLATESSFSEAHPTIQAAKMSYVMSDYGSEVREGFWTPDDDPKIRCLNPLCQRGGFDIGREVQMMICLGLTSKDLNLRCDGDEGSPKGRRTGQPCEYMLKGTLSIIYKSEG